MYENEKEEKLYWKEKYQKLNEEYPEKIQLSSISKE